MKMKKKKKDRTSYTFIYKIVAEQSEKAIWMGIMPSFNLFLKQAQRVFFIQKFKFKTFYVIRM